MHGQATIQPKDPRALLLLSSRNFHFLRERGNPTLYGMHHIQRKKHHRTPSRPKTHHTKYEEFFMVQGLRAGTPMGSPEKRELNCTRGSTWSVLRTRVLFRPHPPDAVQPLHIGRRGATSSAPDHQHSAAAQDRARTVPRPVAGNRRRGVAAWPPQAPTQRCSTGKRIFRP